MKNTTHNKSYKTYAVLQVLKVCAVKFRQQRGIKMQVFTRIRLIARRWLPFFMRLYFILLVTLLTSSKSVELKQIVWNFLPMKVHLGTDLQTISDQLGMDTTRYLWTGYKRQIKQFRLDDSDLKKLTFDNNYFDSLRLNFYSNKLLSIDFYASGNRNVEFLKFDFRRSLELILHQLKPLEALREPLER